MVVDKFGLNIPREDAPYQLRDLPAEWRITDSIGWSDYSPSPVLDHSNYETIMRNLRALEGVVEGSPTGYPNYSFEPDNADWFECFGYVCWKSTLTDKEYSEARRRGHIEAIDPDDPIRCPVLNALLEIRYNLSQYPVLNEDDYYERETDAALESIDCCAPIGMRLTKDQQFEVYRLLTSDEGECRYKVEFSDDDYSVWCERERGDLDDAVKHACFILGYLPLHKHEDGYLRKQPKRPYRTKTRTLVYSWFGGRLPVAAIRYATKRFGENAVANARRQARERKAAA